MSKLPYFMKSKIKRAQEWVLKQDSLSLSSSKATPKETPELPSACTVSSFNTGAFRTGITSELPQYELYNSVILDSGSTIHVGNNRAKFIDLRTPYAHEDSMIIAGDSLVRIEGYGTYKVTVETEGYPDGRTVTFSNVAYVPTFGTSVISLRLLN